MSKKYTAKQISEIMRFVLLGAFEHMEAIKAEIRKIGPIDEKSDPNSISRAKVMQLTLVCINDIIHPAHVLCHYLFGDGIKELHKEIVENHQRSINNKMVSSCYCYTCDPDKSKAFAKMEELSKAIKKDNDEIGQS